LQFEEQQSLKDEQVSPRMWQVLPPLGSEQKLLVQMPEQQSPPDVQDDAEVVPEGLQLRQLFTPEPTSTQLPLQQSLGEAQDAPAPAQKGFAQVPEGQLPEQHSPLEVQEAYAVLHCATAPPSLPPSVPPSLPPSVPPSSPASVPPSPFVAGALLEEEQAWKAAARMAARANAGSRRRMAISPGSRGGRALARTLMTRSLRARHLVNR
jgi:hypothetical protein